MIESGKKKRISALVAVALLLSSLATVVIFIKSEAASGFAKCYYNSSLSIGQTVAISNYMSDYGYTSSCSADPTKAVLSSALSGSNKVVFTHTHGSSSTPILVCSDGNLVPSDITSSSDKLVYLSTCYSAYPTSSTTSFRGKMASLGVLQTVGFQSTISASSDSNGIHYFNKKVFYFLKTNRTLVNSINLSLIDVYAVFGNYYGADYIEYTGDYYTLQ